MLARRLTADQQQQVTATTTLLRTQGALRPLGKVNTELIFQIIAYNLDDIINYCFVTYILNTIIITCLVTCLVITTCWACWTSSPAARCRPSGRAGSGRPLSPGTGSGSRAGCSDCTRSPAPSSRSCWSCPPPAPPRHLAPALQVPLVGVGHRARAQLLQVHRREVEAARDLVVAFLQLPHDPVHLLLL